MIKVNAGIVEISKPDYDLGDRLNLSNNEVDKAMKIIYGAELSCILLSFVDKYGWEDALDLWTQAAADAIKEGKNENNDSLHQ